MKLTINEAELHQAIRDSLPEGLFATDVEIRVIAGRGANGSYAEIDSEVFHPTGSTQSDNSPFTADISEEPQTETEETPEELPEVNADQPALFD